MWPSEGSVSEDVLDLLIGVGLDWVVTDEEILFRTLGAYDKSYRARPIDRRLIYEPYRFEKESRHINMVFRDKNLSNLISFSYADWDPEMAALDLLEHFHKISENMRREFDRGLVTIVMDGENAWEYFDDNGRKFFELLYSGLEEGEEVVSNTVSGFLKSEPARRTLKHLFPGSWIEHNFKIWIGAPQDNTAWQYLAKARRDLVGFTKKIGPKTSGVAADIDKAWRELYIAEGSDWNWWYGPENNLGANNPFDRLFRMHLASVYRLIKKPVPDYLKKPIV
jgi:alpha-amylase/alpha-mannosidase (GH57 family)